jgi:lipopolysaccharide heptosyltransferase II
LNQADSDARWSNVERILCVRLDGIGDVLMCTPAVRALRACGARRRSVTLLVSRRSAALAGLVADVDEFMTYEAPWMKATAPQACSSESDAAMIRALRERRFDAAVIFTTYTQSPLPAAFLCHLAGIPLRVAHCRENPYQLLSYWIRDSEPEAGIRHEVRRQLDLVACVGATTRDEHLALDIPAGAHQHVREMLMAAGVDTRKRWVLLHPGATAPSRRYAPELFAAAVGEVRRRTGCDVVIAGGEHDAALANEIQNSMRTASVNLVGQLNLAQLSALIAAATVLVANNSAPAHIAAAVRTPVVVLYALTNPQHTPWMVASRVLSHDVPCSGCLRSICPLGHNDCLQRVPPARVADAVCELLQTRKPARNAA